MTLSASAACAPPANGDVHGSLDACRLTMVVPSPGVTAGQLDGIRAGLALWNDAAGPPMRIGTFEEAEREGAVELPIAFEDAAPAFYGLYRPESGDVLINRRLVEPRALAVTVAHEIGHAYGLRHADAGGALMSPGNRTVGPSRDDAAAIGAARGPCASP